jgi:hypothetical protein
MPDIPVYDAQHHQQHPGAPADLAGAGAGAGGVVRRRCTLSGSGRGSAP